MRQPTCAPMDGLMDLHLHLDGSLPLETVRALAQRQGVALPEGDALRQSLRVSPHCASLNDYLTHFELPKALLQTPEALAQGTRELAQSLPAQGVVYAEIRFAPQLHMRGGLSQKEAVDAVALGFRESGLPGGLILCCMRGADNERENVETLRVAKRALGAGVLAIDLAGAEAVYPTRAFTRLFDEAREAGLPYTIHAGEADGPESVRAAIELGARRIGHGVRAARDKSLTRLLAQSGIPLELCLTSNLDTLAVESIDAFPLRALLDAGVRVTLNTDNMTVSDTSMRREWQRATEAFALTEDEIQTIRQNAANAAFGVADPSIM